MVPEHRHPPRASNDRLLLRIEKWATSIDPPSSPLMNHCGKSETFQRFQSPKELKVPSSSTTDSLCHLALPASRVTTLRLAH